MSLSMRHPLIVTATIACALTGAMAGCASDTHQAAIPATAAEPAGDEATGTDDESPATQAKAVTDAYESDHFGVSFKVPRGFAVKALEAEYDDEDVDFFCCTDDGASEASFTVCSDILKFADVTDEASWAKAFVAAYTHAMDEAGATKVTKAFGTVTISDDLEGTAVKIQSTEDGATVYRDFYFLADEEGSGLRILLRSDDEKTMETLRQAIGATRE